MDEKAKTSDWLFWKKPAYLKGAREVLGISQEALAKEVGITRQVLANYETGRSLHSLDDASVDDALAIYKVLAVKGSDEGKRAVLALLNLQKGSYERQLVGIRSKFQQLKREKEAIKSWLDGVKSEQKRFRAMKTITRTTSLASLKDVHKGVN